MHSAMAVQLQFHGVACTQSNKMPANELRPKGQLTQLLEHSPSPGQPDQCCVLNLRNLAL